MWSFADPLLLLLAPLPLLFRLRRGADADDGAMAAPETVALALKKADDGARGGGVSAIAAAGGMAPVAVWLLLVLALAGPERTAPAPALPASGRDIMLVLDLSGSMEREDFSLGGANAARLAVVQEVASGFAMGREGDRLGLVVFADGAHAAAPLTHDVAAVASAIQAAEVGLAGRSTGISAGLGLAMRRLNASDAPEKTVILLSDGIDTAGVVRPEDAAALARDLGVRVHAIALGPRDETDGGDQRDVVDAATLARVAERSGGGFFRVRSTADLREVSAEIDRLEGGPNAAPPVVHREGWWSLPAGIAALLALFALTPWGRAW